MKAEELRINNFVMTDKDNHIIHFASFFGLCNVEANPDKFKPIPLTEEWLISAEFERFPWGWVHSTLRDKAVLIRENIQHKAFWIELGNGLRIELPYVHTLQNFFALTGTELTIVSPNQTK